MTDVKISQLPAATLPLLGTEIVPMVQSGVTVQAPINSIPAQAANIVALRSLNPANFTNVQLAGYYTNGDGGGGLFYGVTGGSYTDNGGTIITPNAGADTRAWIRVVEGNISIKMFGAKGDNIQDDTVYIQNAINAAPLQSAVLFPPGTYRLTGNGVTVNKQIDLLGVSTGAPNAVLNCSAITAGSYAIRYSPTTGNSNYRTIKALSLTCDTTAANGIYVKNNGMVIDSVNTGGFNAAITFDITYGWMVSHCNIQGANYGVYSKPSSAGDANQCHIFNSMFFNMLGGADYAAIRMDNVNNITISKCWFELNAARDIYCTSADNIFINESWLETLLPASIPYPRIELQGLASIQFGSKTPSEIKNCRIISPTGTVNQIVAQKFGAINIENIWSLQTNEVPAFDFTATRLVSSKNVFYTGATSANYASSGLGVNIIGAYQLKRYVKNSTDWQVGGSTITPFTNLVKDSSFVAAANFVAGAGTNPPIITQETADGYSDNYSAKIVFNAGAAGLANSARLTDGLASSTAGNCLNISFRIKAAANQTAVIVVTGSGTILTDYVAVNTQWQKVEYKLTMTATGNFYYLYFAPPGDVTQTLWIDDVVIAQTATPLDNVPNAINYSTASTLSVRKGLQLSSYNIGPIKVSYGAAIPTIGTWQRGDIVYNTAPASAGYIGWVCTASGTPGTWTTFGLIT